MATIQIPNHGHCIICGRAVPFGEKSCGKACAEAVEEQTAKRKKQMLLLYGLMAIAFMVAMAPLVIR